MIAEPSAVRSLNLIRHAPRGESGGPVELARVILGINFRIEPTGRTRHSGRTVPGQADGGAPGVTRPTFLEITFANRSSGFQKREPTRSLA